MPQHAKMVNHTFADPDASDVTLRSSDNVDFHVYKLILSLASPIFKDMFSLPQLSISPQDGPGLSDDKAIVPLSEDSRTIAIFLKFCYPAADPELETLEEVQSTLEMMRKYVVGEVQKRLVKVLISPKFIEKEPVRVFAIACRYKLEVEARLAAKYSLGHDLFGEFSTDLEHISAATYHRLLEYRKSCGIAAYTLTTDLQWVPAIWKNFRWYHCTDCAVHFRQWSLNDGKLRRINQWFIDYMEEVGKVLKDWPVPRSASEMTRMAMVLERVTICNSCKVGGFYDLSTFAEHVFAKEIEKVISEVDLIIDC